MIFWAPLICNYIFWKSLYNEYNLDFDELVPIIPYMIMCAK